MAALLVPLALLNVALVANSIHALLNQPPFDWQNYVAAHERVMAGMSPYDADPSTLHAYHYSPLFAYLPLPPDWAWRLAQIGAAFALPSWPLRLIALGSWPLWADVNAGNVGIFVALAAVYAMRGNRWAGYAFFAMTLLMPKPYMIPLAVWLLWKEPAYRIGFVAMFAIHAIGVLATGWAVEWVTVGLLASNAGQYEFVHNISPSRLIGPAWLLVGLPLGAWLFLRGRPVWVGIVASQYLLPPYLLLGLVPQPPKSR